MGGYQWLALDALLCAGAAKEKLQITNLYGILVSGAGMIGTAGSESRVRGAGEGSAPRPVVREAVVRWLAWAPLLVVVVAIAAALSARPSDAQRSATEQVHLRLVFVTHPTCPECKRLEPTVARTPSLTVLDWSKSSDRAEVQRLRAKHPTPPVSQRRIELPMLLACSPNGACKEWVGASRIRGALAALGVWQEDALPSGQLAVAAFGLAIGLALGRTLRLAAPLLLLAAALGAVARLGEQCSTCGSEQSWTTLFTVGAGLGACLLGWMLMPRAFAGSWSSLALPLLLGAMLAA